MSKAIEKIISAKGLSELLGEIDTFCENSYMRDDDTECMELKEQVGNIKDSDIHMILASYLSVCEDGDEVVESLYEFVSNCKGFAEVDEAATQQVTKDEFETILSECEEKIGIQSYMDDNEYKLKTAEVPMTHQHREFATKFKGKDILLYLPRIDKGIDTKQYIAEELGGILYGLVIRKLKPDVVLRELNRYIPETRNSEESTKQLFRKYFYSVVQYKERAPGIYPKFDSHMKQVLDMEFFKRIIQECYRE